MSVSKSSVRCSLASVAAMAGAAGLASSAAFALAPSSGSGLRGSFSSSEKLLFQVELGMAAAAAVPGEQPAGVSTGLLACATAAAAAALGAVRRSSHRRSSAASARAPTHSARACGFDYGEDLSVPDDSFVVLGLAHCFEQGEGGKLKQVFVLEPVTASTVEVVDNGAATSYETFIGTTVGELLKQDASAFPAELLCGREVQWADDLKFRTGCAARTWMRDHARDVVRLLVPANEVRTGFSTSTEDKRILNFVNEVKDSDNVKQDMSIDVYGREDEDESKEGGVDSQIADLYNV